MKRINLLSASTVRRFASQAPAPQDHYKTLGLKRDASPKEIKAAFYTLSKKYHPDTNPENPETAAEMFQKIVTAYETLGVSERRKIYDKSIIPRYSAGDYRTHVRHNPTHERRKQYTDIDIDYKDFEHFQRTNRRKRVFHDYWEMPKEFYKQFGEKENKGTADEGFYTYSDNRAVQREEEERRLQQELEQMKLKAKHPLPTFEQLLRNEEQARRDRQRKSMSIGLGVVSTLGILLFALMHRR